VFQQRKMDSTVELTDDSLNDNTILLDDSVTPERKQTRGGDKLGDTINLGVYKSLERSLNCEE
jgi:hypothetical protein